MYIEENYYLKMTGKIIYIQNMVNKYLNINVINNLPIKFLILKMTANFV